MTDDSVFGNIFTNPDSAFNKIFGPYKETKKKTIRLTLTKDHLPLLKNGNTIRFRADGRFIEIALKGLESDV